MTQSPMSQMPLTGQNATTHLCITVCSGTLRTHFLLIMSPAPRGSDSKRCCCLTTVCRIHGSNSRTQSPRKTKMGTQVAHVTRDSYTTLEVKRSKVNLQGRGNIVADSHTSLIFMVPTAIGSKGVQLVYTDSPVIFYISYYRPVILRELVC